MLPILQKQLLQCEGEPDEEAAINFLKAQEFEFTFEFNAEEDSYIAEQLSGGYALIEDILEHLNCDVDDPLWEVEKCFNLSENKDAATAAYIRMHCAKDMQTYEVNIGNELKNQRFLNVLRSSGAIETITKYISSLKRLANTYKTRNTQPTISTPSTS